MSILLLKILHIMFLILSVVFAVLLGLSFFNPDDRKYPLIKYVSDKKIIIFIAFIFCTLITIWMPERKTIELNVSRSPLIITLGPGDKEVQKATLTGFRNELALMNVDQKRKDDAERYFDQAERFIAVWNSAEAVKNYVKSIETLPTMSSYLNLGLHYWYIYRLDYAEQSYKMGLDIAKTRNNKEFEAAFLNATGNLMMEKDKTDEALVAYSLSLTINKSTGDMLAQAADHGNLGRAYRQKKDLDNALAHFQSSLDIHNELDEKLAKANILGNIGNVYREKGEFEKSLDIFQKLLVIHIDIKDIDGLARDHANIGLIYKILGIPDKGLEHLHKARILFQDRQQKGEYDKVLSIIQSMDPKYKASGTP